MILPQLLVEAAVGHLVLALLVEAVDAGDEVGLGLLAEAVDAEDEVGLGLLVEAVDAGDEVGLGLLMEATVVHLAFALIVEAVGRCWTVLAVGLVVAVDGGDGRRLRTSGRGLVSLSLSQI